MSRFLKTLAWFFAAAIVAVSVFVAIVSAGQATVDVGGALQQIFWVVSAAAFAVTAAIIVSHQPRNVVGWLLMASVVGSVTGELVAGWVNALDGPPDTVSVGLLAALAYDNFSWVLFIFPVFHLLLVFPTGRLLSRRWRWVVWLEVGMVLTMFGLAAFPERSAPFSEDAGWSVDNPIGFIPSSVVDGPFLPIWTGLLIVVVLSGLVSVVLRYRRAGTTERHQIKWLLFAVAIFVVVYAVSAVLGEWDDLSWLGVLLYLSIANIGFSIAIAVTRYHLFDIDRIVSRTVGYTIVVGALTAIYLGLVTLVTELTPVSSDLAVAAATLGAAALFNPLRRRVLLAVDRRFNRSGYEAKVVVERFAAALRDSLSSADGLTASIAETIDQTLEPASLGVWLDQVDRPAPT